MFAVHAFLHCFGHSLFTTGDWRDRARRVLRRLLRLSSDQSAVLHLFWGDAFAQSQSTAVRLQSDHHSGIANYSSAVHALSRFMHQGVDVSVLGLMVE